jgi:hypothetical protein
MYITIRKIFRKGRGKGLVRILLLTKKKIYAFFYLASLRQQKSMFLLTVRPLKLDGFSSAPACDFGPASKKFVVHLF